ncbi:MAG: flagellar export protein FliJ [Succinivibrio sp.]|nr:flagellar export protein FliJ [Succinivibrio sp.]
MAGDSALLRVLELRENEEKQAMERWSAAVNSVHSYEQQIAQIERFSAVYAQEMAERTAPGMGMGVFMSYQNFLDKLAQITLRQQKALEDLRVQEQRLKEEYLERQKARKIIESLLEKHRLERLKAEAVAERKLSDDIVSSKQARMMMRRS